MEQETKDWLEGYFESKKETWKFIKEEVKDRKLRKILKRRMFGLENGRIFKGL